MSHETSPFYSSSVSAAPLQPTRAVGAHLLSQSRSLMDTGRRRRRLRKEGVG